MGSSLQVAAGSTTDAMQSEARRLSAVALAMPAIVVLAPPAISIVASLCFATGLVFLRAPQPESSSALLTDPIVVAGLSFVGFAFLSVLAQPSFDGYRLLALYAAVPAGFAMLHTARNHDLRAPLWWGAVAGSLGSGVVAVGVVMFTDIVRPTSFVNAIHFGELALVLGVVATATRRFAPLGEALARRLTFAAVAAAGAAAVLSHARGAWVAVPALAMLVLIQDWRSGSQNTARHVAWAFVVLVPMAVVAGTANDQAAVRALNRGFDETITYIAEDGGNQSGETSVGSRFEMWRSAFAGFRGSPMLGVGWGNMDERFLEDVAAGVRASRIAEHDQPHNQYLSHLSSGGLLGLGSLMALLLVPGIKSLRAFRSDDSDAQDLGAAGLLTIVGFSAFFLTDSVLESAAPLLFYVVMIGMITSQIHRVQGEVVALTATAAKLSHTTSEPTENRPRTTG